MDGMNEGWQGPVPVHRGWPPAVTEAKETPSPHPGCSPVLHLPSCVPLTFTIMLGREDTFLPMSSSVGTPRDLLPPPEASAGCVQTGRQAPHPLALFQTTIYCLGKLVLTVSEMSGRRTNRAENSSLVMTAPDGTMDPAA